MFDRLMKSALVAVVLLMPQAGAQAQIPGTALQGSTGVQLRNDALMRLQQAAPAAEQARLMRRPVYPDREALPQNPDAPAVSAVGGPADLRKIDRALPRKIHTTAVSFNGATLTDTSAFPPDSMGAVGPTQFISFVNGRLRSFTKAGVADGVLNADPDVFFASVMTPVGGTVALTFTSDPQVRYDRFTGRWFLTLIDVPCTDALCTTTVANRVLIAVSDAASQGTITASTVWTFFQFTASPGTDFADYPSLGVDVNALYIGANMFSNAGSFVGTNGYVVRKSSILGAGPVSVTMFANLAAGAGAGPFSPRGVDNVDPSATEGYFVGVDNATFSTLVVRRASNPGSATPTISANISLTVPTTTFPAPVDHLGNTGGNNGRLDSLDDRLYAATMRNGRLWTAHNFRVSSAGVANTAAAARVGSRWYELQNLTTTPTLVQSGTVYDNAATLAAARQYWIPSVTVTGQGHAVMGMTMAGTPVGATPVYVGRLAGDTLGTMTGPPTVAATAFGTTTANYNPPSDPGGASGRRWGDYSFTSVDPLDEMTVWTIQEYNQASNSYAVRVGKLLAPPPATPTCTGSPIAFTGPTGNVVITATSSGGSGFYDPGPNLPAPARPYSHLTATVTNATVNSVTYNSPTQVTLNITASASGLQNVTLVNPDGQSVVANGCIDVSAAAPTVTAISPSQGPTTGGTAVSITGTNFTGATAVTIGGAAATGVTVVNSTTITATAPAGAAGTASVLVTTAGGTNTANTLYTYVAPPTVAAISPTQGPTTGGTAVTITGTNFTGATSVTIGGAAATGVTVVNSTTITGTTPAGTIGAKNVVVTTPGGTATGTGLFTYTAPPPQLTGAGSRKVHGSAGTFDLGL